MLTPEQWAEIPLGLTRLFEELEDFTIADISKRVAKLGRLTDATAYEAARLTEIGTGIDKIQAEAAKTMKKTQAEAAKIIDEATIRSLQADDAKYRAAGLRPTDPKVSPYVQSVIKAVTEQTLGELANITGTLGFKTATGFSPIAGYYQNACDLAHLKITTGIADYQTAVRGAVRDCARSGIRSIEYESGRVYHADVAIRRSVMSGVRKTTGELGTYRADELGVTTMEITAHAGARPDHARWQGQIVDRSGRDPRHLTLADIGYGEGGGFQGWNCRHDWSPFVPGISQPTYSRDDLDKIDPPPREIGGKKYTYYEATQEQRRMETDMREIKREIVGYEAAGDESEKIAKQAKLRLQYDEYRAFSRKAGLLTRKNRIEILGVDY